MAKARVAMKIRPKVLQFLRHQRVAQGHGLADMSLILQLEKSVAHKLGSITLHVATVVSLSRIYLEMPTDPEASLLRVM